MKTLFIFISILSFNYYSQCGETSSGFDNCGFYPIDDISYERFNVEILKLEDKISKRIISPITLPKVNSGEIISKDLIDNILLPVMFLNDNTYESSISNNIKSSEIRNYFNSAFNYVESNLFTGFSQEALNGWSGYNQSILNDGYKSSIGLVNYTQNDIYSYNIYRGIVFNLKN